jgi:hypothetical protein
MKENEKLKVRPKKEKDLNFFIFFLRYTSTFEISNKSKLKAKILKINR